MTNVNIIVMGRDGVGKSTLINNVFGEEVAPTGKNHVKSEQDTLYSKKILLTLDDSKVNGQSVKEQCQVNMYDTVGLGRDEDITKETLERIKKEMRKLRTFSEDVFVIWFCVDNRNEQWESCELDLLKKLSVDYKIPFIMVFTMNYSEDEGVLEKQIRENLYGIPVLHMLTEGNDDGNKKLSDTDIERLLNESVYNYEFFLSAAKSYDERRTEEFVENQNKDICDLKSQGNEVIARYSSMSAKIALIPGGCVPAVHAICVKMITDLNKLMGINLGKEYTEEIVADIFAAVVATPFMFVPLISVLTAKSYIEVVGEDYLRLLIKAEQSSYEDVIGEKIELAEKIKRELKNKFKS